MNAATAGAVVCGNGTYTSLTLTDKDNASDIIVQSANPDNPMSLSSVNLTRSSHWKFQGIHFTGDSDLLGNRDITLTHNLHESGQLKLSASDVLNYGTVVPNANILIDHDKFTNYHAVDGGHEGRLELYGSVAAGQQTVHDGFTIQYSYFLGGYPNSCSDGIQMVASVAGAVIRYNEFADMAQGACVQEHPGRFLTSIRSRASAITTSRSPATTSTTMPAQVGSSSSMVVALGPW